jgi:phospholipase D1/2
VKNQIGAALVERILSAAKAGRKFKICVLMPELP